MRRFQRTPPVAESTPLLRAFATALAVCFDAPAVQALALDS